MQGHKTSGRFDPAVDAICEVTGRRHRVSPCKSAYYFTEAHINQVQIGPKKYTSKYFVYFVFFVFVFFLKNIYLIFTVRHISKLSADIDRDKSKLSIYLMGRSESWRLYCNKKIYQV